MLMYQKFKPKKKFGQVKSTFKQVLFLKINIIFILNIGWNEIISVCFMSSVL